MMERAEDKTPRILEEETGVYRHAASKHVFSEPESSNATFKAENFNDRVRTSDFTEPEDEFKPEPQSKEEYPLLDAEEASPWLEEARTNGRSGGRSRSRSTKRKSRSTSRKRRSKSARRGNVHMNYGPVTYNYWNCHAATTSSSPCVYHGSKVHGGSY
jgi:hypothetical protein